LSALVPFSCSWCGAAVAPTADALERWTLLCSSCLTRAPEQPYLRAKLKEGLRLRGAGGTPPVGIPLPTTAPVARAPIGAATEREGVPARLGLLPPPQDPDALEAWYLNRAPYDRGPLAGATWQGELDRAVLWLDALPFAGRIVELGAGIGFWTVLLASRGETSAYDGDERRLERARRRLIAHGLSAHLHPRAIDAGPEGTPAGLVVLPFVLSQLSAEARRRQVAAARDWLTPGGRIAVIDLAPPNLDAALLEQAVGEMLGGTFTERRGEPLGRHLVLIDAIAE
jgi:SAM-dependent methyltransferase